MLTARLNILPEELIVVEAVVLCRFLANWPVYKPDIISVINDAMDASEAFGLLRFRDRHLSDAVKSLTERRMSSSLMTLKHANGFMSIDDPEYWLRGIGFDILDAIDDITIGCWDVVELWAMPGGQEVTIGIRSRRL